MKPALLIIAHGTRSQAGTATVRELTALVAQLRPGLVVELGFVDVLAPTTGDALAKLDGPVVIVPALLSTGVHVRTDIPAAVEGRADVVVTPHLGPDRRLSQALAERLATTRAGRAAGRVVLVSAGSSDPAARLDLDGAAADLADELGAPVTGAAINDPDLDLTGADVARYLLAPGTFADLLAQRARAAGAASVSDPIGSHPAVARLILARYDDGCSVLARAQG